MTSHPIHSYRPQRTAPEDLEAIFVGREHLLEEMLGRLKDWTPGASRQHYLIIGPRGIGKTNLLTLIAHRIERSPELNAKWVPLAIAEDTYGITRISDLLIESVRILGDKTGESSIRKAYDRVRFDDNDARVTDLTLDAFRHFHKSSGRGIVLMVENLNRLLERQIKQKAEIHLLRKILIEEDWLITICTSPTYLNAVTQPEEPLFEFFKVQLLPELTQREQFEMLKKRAALEENIAFENYLSEFRSRLRALYHFTGGNPRLTLMLYDLVSKQDLSGVTMELDLLLDQITPFYQDRMKEIPEQQAKLLEAMALMPEGCTPTELAEQVRMAPNQVRALLTRLAQAGYVRAEERQLKKTVYIIPERFFRIWHQMNHSREVRGRIQYLLEFFASWYATREERDHISEQTVALLIKAFRDEAIGVRSSAAITTVHIVSERSMPDLAEGIDTVIKDLAHLPYDEAVEIARTLLRSAFRAANLNIVRGVLGAVTSHLSSEEILWAPYMIAAEYLQSERDPAILNRQHPEMREAVQLLVDAFDNHSAETDE
ncbi:MAG: AAA family ATPase [Blastocatellia bacterium]|nr:AAA family ATPase [Blastocatellia bacterium]